MKEGQNKRDGLVESPGEKWVVLYEDNYGPPTITILRMFLDFLSFMCSLWFVKVS